MSDEVRARLPEQGEVVDVEVEGIDDEGRGRAHGGADVQIAVRGAFPGDRARVKIERLFPARNLAVGRALQILEEGPLRVERLCPHEAPCPGCPLEGLEPSAALELKRGRVLQALAEVGLGHLPVDDVVAGDEPYGARQKVKLTAGGRRGALKLGMYVPYSHVLVSSERCPYQAEEITEAAAEVLRVLDGRGVQPAPADPTGLKAVVLRAFEEGVGAVVVVGAPLDDLTWRALSNLVDQEALATVSERVDAAGGNSLVAGAVARTRGEPYLSPLEGGPPVTVDAFCQADPEQAEVLYALAADFLVQEDPSGSFVDAYAGTGGFSRALLDAGAARVVAVERAPQSAEALDQLDVEALKLSVEEALPLLRARERFRGVVVDPPKKGLGDLADAVAALGADRVALAACDPDAMARDAARLVAAGYTVSRVVPIDMFPGTPEVETLVLFERGL